MRLLACIIFLFSFSTLVSGQDSWNNLVKWEASYNKESSSIDLKASIQKGWVIYSQFTPDDGPIPLEIDFIEMDGVEFLGGTKEIDEPIKEVSKLFEMEVLKFKDTALFRQTIKLDSETAHIKGNVTFMACDHEKCLPPKTVPFEVKI